MTKLKTTLAVIGIVVTVVVVAVGIYLGSWWLVRDTTNRDAEVRQQTYGRQNALVEAILDDIREAEAPATPPEQRVAIVNIVCDNAGTLTGSIELPRHAQTFINQECP